MTITAEQALADWAAAELAGDASTLGSLLTDDFLGVGPLGFVLDKPAWLARFAGGLVYDKLDLEEVQARHRGEAVVVTARQVARGTPLPFEALRATFTLVLSGPQWQIAGIHMSFIAGTAGAPPIPDVPAPTGAGEQAQH